MALKVHPSKFDEAKPLLIGLAVIAAVAGFVVIMRAQSESTDIRSKAASNLPCEQVCANVGTGLQEAGSTDTHNRCLNQCKRAQEEAAKQAAKDAAKKAEAEKRRQNQLKREAESKPRLRQK